MAPTSIQQERREVWESILDEVRQHEIETDPDRAAACCYLARHLLDSAAPPATRRAETRGSYRFTGTTSSKMFCGN